MKHLVAVLLFVIVLVFSGCGGGGGNNGGGGGGGNNPTITSVTANCPAQVAVGSTAQCSATVTGTGNFSSAVTWSVQSGGGSISASGLATAPATVPNPAQMVVKATSNQDGTKSGTATLAIVQAPSISMPASAVAALGGSVDLSVTVTGSPTPSVSCNLQSGDPGSVPASPSGGILTYSVPTAKPASWTATAHCTATNSVSTANASTSVTLQYPTPTITSTSPETIYLSRPGGAFGGFVINGSGFYPGGTVQFNDGAPIALPDSTTFNQASFTFGFDTAHYDPKSNKAVIASPAEGHGGGSSNPGYFAFLGNGNALPVDHGEAFVLDQAAGSVRVFDTTTGAKLREFVVGSVTDIAIDDVTGHLILAKGTEEQVVDRNGNSFSSSGNGNRTFGASALGGHGCLSQDDVGWLVSLDMSSATPILAHDSIGNTPRSVAMANLSGDGLVCVSFNIGDGVLSVEKVPEMQLLRFTNVSGITLLSSLAPGRGGTQISVFRSGPQAGTAALLANADNLVVFFNLGTAQETRRVSVSGNPFRIAVDDTNGKLIVAVFNATTGGTKFISVNPADGSATDLVATVPFLATSIAISADGTKIYAGNRNDFAVINNQ